MSTKLLQYADFELNFTNVKQSIDPTNLDLSLLDDIELVISQGSIKNPIINVKRSTSPSIFTVDNDNSAITIKLTNADLGSILGVYFFNLWLISGGRRITHFVQKFVLVPTIKY